MDKWCFADATKISCRWQTRAIVLQTNNVDAQCDKLATELSRQRLESKVANLSSIAPIFNLPHLHLAPSLRVSPFEFCSDYRRRKTGVPGLFCGVVCVISRFSRTSTCDRRTDRRTDTRRQLVTALASVARVKCLSFWGSSSPRPRTGSLLLDPLIINTVMSALDSFCVIL